MARLHVLAAVACVVAVLAQYALYVRPGKGCSYHFFWPSLGAVGELIVRARGRGLSSAQAWEQWLSSDARDTGRKLTSGLGRRYFNGTVQGFRALWEMRQCPPGPCGPYGRPCPRHAEGFQCGRVTGDAYCCNNQGCYHDGCDNDGCFPHYAPYSSVNPQRCGRGGECPRSLSLWLQPWQWQWQWQWQWPWRYYIDME